VLFVTFSAGTDALRENLFATVVCIDALVPLVIIGPAGCSKTLSFTIAVDNMRGKWSVYKELHQVIANQLVEAGHFVFLNLRLSGASVPLSVLGAVLGYRSSGHLHLCEGSSEDLRRRPAARKQAPQCGMLSIPLLSIRSLRSRIHPAALPPVARFVFYFDLL
jgi:hypothetical protein